MNNKTKKLIDSFPGFKEEQEKYYKKHPEEIKYLVKALLDDFNEDISFDDKTFMKILLRIAKLNGMAQIARKSGINRVSLYKALAPGANPSFKTMRNLTSALGIKMNFTYAGK
jgi:probable addiction module antidote protein